MQGKGGLGGCVDGRHATVTYRMNMMMVEHQRSGAKTIAKASESGGKCSPYASSAFCWVLYLQVSSKHQIVIVVIMRVRQPNVRRCKTHPMVYIDKCMNKTRCVYARRAKNSFFHSYYARNLFPGRSPTGTPKVANNAWKAVCRIGSGQAAATV